MKKTIVIFFILFVTFQTGFAQNDNIKNLMSNASTEFNNGDYQATLNSIQQIKKLFKSTPPSILALEILANSEIIKVNPYEDYYRIEKTRNLIKKYLLIEKSKADNNRYSSVLQEKSIMDTYPKDKETFDSELAEVRRLEALEKEREEKAAAAEKERLEAIRIAEIQEAQRQDSIRLVRIKEEEIRKQNQAIQAEKDRIAYELDVKERIRIAREEAERERIRKEAEAKAEQRRLKSFSSLGIETGDIAKYGLLYECGGGSFIGFHMSARSSITSDDAILNGIVKANKTEIDLGPNFKILKRVYLNLGVGYGYYAFINRNDYADKLLVDKKGYLEASAGLMIRFNRIININCAASFMDVDKDFYNPEIIFGISFNLKSNTSRK